MVEFRVAFEAISSLSIEELSERFYDWADGVLSERSGRITVFAYVEARSGFEAGLTAIHALEGMGFSIVRVDQDLVDGPEIASRLNVTRQAVQNWAKGDRGASFPHPLGSVGGKRIWAWSQVVDWATREGRTDEAPSLSLDEAACIDAMLAGRRMNATGQSIQLDWAIGRGNVKANAGTSGAGDYIQKRLRSDA